jgi:glutamine cyclotransferase
MEGYRNSPEQVKYIHFNLVIFNFLDRIFPIERKNFPASFNNPEKGQSLFLRDKSPIPKAQFMNRFSPLALLVWLAACTNTDSNTGTTGNNPAADAPKSIGYSVINTYRHDTSSFIQGLVVYDGKLYEGTGNYGHSHLMQVDLATGTPQKKIALDPRYFGEGITVLRDTLYQLTWKEKLVLVYTLKDLKKVKEYPINTEGWGITTNGQELIVSDGTSNLYYYNPSGFQLLRTQSITEGGSLSYNLNELEYIDGYVFANQWQAPYILKIDPGSGSIVGKVDLTNIWNRVKAKDPAVDVPNGIAYDSASKKIYITGKNWPELYEIELSK